VDHIDAGALVGFEGIGMRCSFYITVEWDRMNVTPMMLLVGRLLSFPNSSTVGVTSLYSGMAFTVVGLKRERIVCLNIDISLNVHSAYYTSLLSRLHPLLLPFTIPIPKKAQMRPHQYCILHELLHTIHQPVPIPTRQDPLIPYLPLRREMRVRFRNRRLIRDREHAHPPAQKA